MSFRIRVLSLLALSMASGSALATSDPFDPELFLSPYGEVTSPIIVGEAVVAEAPDLGIESPLAGLIFDGSAEDRPPDEKPAETGGLDTAAIELALQPTNFITAEEETASFIAADLASLLETTGSVESAGSIEMLCLEGYEDR